MGQRRSDGILRRCVLEYRFCAGIHQNRVNGRQFAKHSEKARELRGRAGADRARTQLVFEPRISARAENARYKFPGPLVRGRYSRRSRIG